jgi:hypothetical protein
METRIKIRRRSPFPKPWKWEIYVGDRLITASDASYASQAEAHASARSALSGRADRKAITHVVREGRMVPKSDG